jgi:probable F420-dependent oxidoreductase
MHIGLTMFPTEYAIEPHVLAKEAEARGFESIWFPEHTHIPASRRTPYPAGGDLPKEYWHTFDPFGALCAAAAVTNTIHLGTGVCLLIERDTIITAKQAATVDRLSAGRFLFGIGGGWNAEEMENHGTDYKTRFKKLREQVLAIREIWTKEAAEFHGEMVRFDPIWCHPKPMQKPGPPVILGGMSAHAMDRAIDYGDGWMPLDGGRGPDSLSPMIAEFQRRLVARARASIGVTIFGAPQRAEALSKYQDLGVERAVLMIRPETSEVLLPKLDRMAKLIPTSSSPRPS